MLQVERDLTAEMGVGAALWASLFSYNEILAKTSASSATISRVNRSLMNGQGAYDMVFERIEGEE